MRPEDNDSFVHFMTSRDGLPANLFAWALLILGVVVPALVCIAR